MSSRPPRREALPEQEVTPVRWHSCPTSPGPFSLTSGKPSWTKPAMMKCDLNRYPRSSQIGIIPVNSLLRFPGELVVVPANFPSGMPYPARNETTNPLSGSGGRLVWAAAGHAATSAERTVAAFIGVPGPTNVAGRLQFRQRGGQPDRSARAGHLHAGL